MPALVPASLRELVRRLVLCYYKGTALLSLVVVVPVINLMVSW
jgi:hypothetical protein